MLGTIVNCAAILAGGALGLLLKKGLPQKLSDSITQGVALIVLYIGISGSLKGQNALIATIAMVVGGVIGTLLDLDGRINALAKSLERLLVKKDGGESTFGEGFVTATLLFCVGAMAVVGSLNSGLTGNHEVLFTKSVLDGVSSIVFASALGGGVLLSAVPLLLYQGGITLLAQVIAPALSDAVVAEMTCVGSLLIVAIGTNMLKITHIKVMNFLPAIFLPILLCFLMGA
jgi:uncharacterized membrane protein YqgA involved in biofilm formation